MNFVQEHLAGQVDFRAFYAAEGVVFRGKRALCPFHDDHAPSFDVDSQRGVYICRACGEGGDPVTFLMKRGGVSEAEAIADLKRRFNVNGGPPPPVARRAVASKEYQIRDHGGEIVALHRRTDFDDGSKSFTWARPDGTSGLGGTPAARLPLYGSEELAGAPTETLVLLVEGEKARDVLTERGYLTVASVTGAPAAPGAAPLEVLRGRDVVLWPDNDDAGRLQMERIAAGLADVAASVRVLTWGEQPKDDAFDFFARAGTAEQLDSLLAEAAPWTESESKALETDPEAVPVGYRSPAEVLDAIPQPKFRFPSGIPSIDAACRGGLPTGCVVIFVGWPDAGKTGLGTQIILEIAMKNEVVAVLFTPDGGQQATAIRIGGLLGLDQDKLEERDPEEKERLRALLRQHRIFIVDDAQDGMVYEQVRADMEKVRPDLPHVYLIDSAQECLATDAADELDERHRVIALARAAYKTVEANPIPSLALVTSQVAGQSFAPRKRDRTAPIGSPAESKKLSFLSHMIIYLEGDPAKEPDFGQAAVVKSKLRGPKPSFGLRVDSATSRLSEIDAVVVEQNRAERTARDETTRISALGDQVTALLVQHGPLNVSAIYERIQAKKQDLLKALFGLEAQGVAVWDPGPKNSRIWRLASVPL
jgi:DNA primase (bacterial type)